MCMIYAGSAAFFGDGEPFFVSNLPPWVVHSLCITICASNEENALLAGVFDEYRDSRKALRRNCYGQSNRKIDSIF